MTSTRTPSPLLVRAGLACTGLACAGLLGLACSTPQGQQAGHSATPVQALGQPAAGEQARATTAQDTDAVTAIVVPRELPKALRPRTLVVTDLLNPRGMHVLPSGDLLIAEAGSGDPQDPQTGRLSRLVDSDHDGRFLANEERVALLSGQPSRNILDIVRRDEVFGLAGMDASPERILVSLAFFGGPTTLFAIDQDRVSEWSTTHLNINDVTYSAQARAWFGVASTTNEVVRLQPDKGAERVLSLPTLESGQDAVPGYLVSEPNSKQLLVSLFSGSPEGEEGGEGVELVPGAGAIVRVNPENKTFSWAVKGLTVPTDLVVAEDGSIYVLEFCDAFVDPVKDMAALLKEPGHGGFRRFSGRLLHVDPVHSTVTVVAEGLDVPSNLHLAGGYLYISQGMGTPGRMIPPPAGQGDSPVPLRGFVERIALSAP